MIAEEKGNIIVSHNASLQKLWAMNSLSRLPVLGNQNVETPCKIIFNHLVLQDDICKRKVANEAILKFRVLTTEWFNYYSGLNAD